MKPLLTGIGAIALAALLLLLSDLESRSVDRPIAGSAGGGPGAGRPQKQWRVRVLEFVNIPDCEEAEKGVLDALRESGLAEDRDYEIRVTNAQGDMAALNGLVDAALTDRADLIVTLSTPTLQAALRRARTTPIVCTFVADPFIAGAGKSNNDHLPYVTGAYGAGDVDGMVALIGRVLPGARRVGTVYSPTEVNSVINHDAFVAAARKAGLEIEAMGVNTPSEVSDATAAVCGKQIDLLCLPTANMTAAAFPAIIQTARRTKTPVFTFLGGLAAQGAVAALARDYYDMGHAAGELAARVIHGERPANVPFHPMTTTKLYINRESAKQCGIELSEDLLREAHQVFER
jgi:putative ABC transport system substrate-binding protein